MANANDELLNADTDFGDVGFAFDGNYSSIDEVPALVASYAATHPWTLIVLVLLFFACKSCSWCGFRQFEAFTLVFYISSLVEDLVALGFLEDASHSESELLLAFLAFPFADFILKEMAESLTPCCTLDDIVISIGLEAVQSLLFAYFADFRTDAVIFFAVMFVLQSLNLLGAYLPGLCKDTAKPEGESRPWCSCSALRQQIIEKGGTFTSQTITLSSFQVVWILLDINVHAWADTSLTVLAWLVGLYSVAGDWQEETELATSISHGKFIATISMLLSVVAGGAANLVLLAVTEFFLVEHWDLVVGAFFGSNFFAFIVYLVYVTLSTALIVITLLLVIERDSPKEKKSSVISMVQLGTFPGILIAVLHILFTVTFRDGFHFWATLGYLLLVAVYGLWIILSFADSSKKTDNSVDNLFPRNKKKEAAQKEMEEIKASFRKFDTNGDGFLTKDEIVGVLTRPSGGAPLTEAEAEAYIARYDTNKDGKLSIDEFAAATAVLSWTTEGLRATVAKQNPKELV